MQVTGTVLNRNTELGDLILNKNLSGMTPQDAIAEYAARVCYASEGRMGDAPGFLRDRLAEGHADVIEHGWISVFSAFTLGLSSRYLVETEHDDGYRTSGNVRAWYDCLAHINPKGRLMHHLRLAAPSVFGEPEVMPTTLAAHAAIAPEKHVQALGWAFVAPDDDRHNHATMLLDGVSRSLTHQLVRHRLGSFSQQSQRYVDQNKAGWGYVIPSSIASDPESVYLYYDCMNAIQVAYNRLRDSKIRKEDARYVLPNAATTKIVVSMPFDGWRHFIWLRALDKAAQWEIRGVAQEMLELLYAIAPSAWEKEMEQLSTDKRLKDGLQ